MFSDVTNKCTKLTGAHVECLSLCLDKDKIDRMQALVELRVKVDSAEELYDKSGA